MHFGSPWYLHSECLSCVERCLHLTGSFLFRIINVKHDFQVAKGHFQIFLWDFTGIKLCELIIDSRALLSYQLAMKQD